MTNKEKLQLALETLRLVKRTYDEAHPKFNWGASALDANALDLLNRSGLAVDRTVRILER